MNISLKGYETKVLTKVMMDEEKCSIEESWIEETHIPPPAPQLDKKDIIIKNLEVELERIKNNNGTSLTPKCGYREGELSSIQHRHAVGILLEFLREELTEVQAASIAEPPLLLKLTKELYLSEKAKLMNEIISKEEEKNVLVSRYSRRASAAKGGKLRPSVMHVLNMQRKDSQSTVRGVKKKLPINTAVSASHSLLEESHKVPSATSESKAEDGVEISSVTLLESKSGLNRYNFRKLNLEKRFEENYHRIRKINPELNAKIKMMEEEIEKYTRMKSDCLRKITDLKLEIRNLRIIQEEKESLKFLQVEEKASMKYDRYGNPVTVAEENYNEVAERKLINNYNDAIHLCIMNSKCLETALKNLKNEQAQIQEQYEIYVEQMMQNVKHF